MNHSLLEYYETAYEKIKDFKQDRFLYRYLKQILFSNTKIVFEHDESFTISTSNDDEYAGIEFRGDDIIITNIKSIDGDPMSLHVNEISLINGEVVYSERFVGRDSMSFGTTARIVTKNGQKYIKTTLSNGVTNRKRTTSISVGDSYLANVFDNQFSLLRKSSFVNKIIDSLVESQKSLNLNSSEIEHKMEAVDMLNLFEFNGFVYSRAFDIALLANTDESVGDDYKLSYQVGNRIIGVDVSDNIQSLYCAIAGTQTKSTFSCINGKFVAERVFADGKRASSKIVLKDGSKCILCVDQYGRETQSEFPFGNPDDLYLMSTFSYVGRDALYDINSNLYDMTKDEPYNY